MAAKRPYNKHRKELAEDDINELFSAADKKRIHSVVSARNKPKKKTWLQKLLGR